MAEKVIEVAISAIRVASSKVKFLGMLKKAKLEVYTISGTEKSKLIDSRVSSGLQLGNLNVLLDRLTTDEWLFRELRIYVSW